MAKDPAFLFYPGDVLQEVALMNNTQKGLYLTLICYLHKNKHISYEQLMIITAGTSEEDRRVMLGAMQKDAAGNFYIEWLRTESERRRLYSESRASNRLGGKKTTTKKQKARSAKSYVQHMETETEADTDTVTEAAAATKTARENPQSLHGKMKEAFIAAHHKKLQIPFVWDAKSGSHINLIIPKIRTVAKSSDDDTVLQFWQTLLENIPDWYLQNAFTPAIINSKFNEIVSKIHKPHVTNQLTLDRQLAEIAAAGNPYART